MKFSLLSIFGVTLYVALILASLMGRPFFFDLLRIIVLLYLLTCTVGCLLECGERRAFCVGFATFGWAFWCFEYMFEIWSFSPIGVLLSYQTSIYDMSMFRELVLTAIVGIAFFGGMTGAAMYRKNHPENGQPLGS